MTKLDLYMKDLYDNYKDIFNLSKTGIIIIEPRYKDLNFTEIFSILKDKYSNLFSIELIQNNTELPSLKYKFKLYRLKEHEQL